MFKVLKAASSLATPNNVRLLASEVTPALAPLLLKFKQMPPHINREGEAVPMYAVTGQPNAIRSLKKQVSNKTVVVPLLQQNTYGVASHDLEDQKILSDLAKARYKP